MQNKKVIYTALFGPRGKLLEPKKIDGWDFVCFTDRKEFKSDVWDMRVVEPTFQNDPTRNARMYKILPHIFLPEYDVSVWIDANILPQKDPASFVEQYLSEKNIAIFNHMNNVEKWDCVYREYQNLLHLHSYGRYKDDPEVMKKQIEKYRQEGYPEHNGMIVSMIMFRRHNETDVVKVMEAWWHEVKNFSKRDQLSFNYAAWKTHLDFVWLPGDSRNNEWFSYFAHEKPPLTARVQRFLRRFV